MASSGIDIAKAMLITDKNNSNHDSLQEEWADSEKISELLQDIPFEDGTIKLTITDELGKIQINSLVTYPEGHAFNESQRDMWHRFLTLLISQNEESDYYQDLDPPYVCRNAPFIHIGELALIRGITTEYLQLAGGVSGISRYMTVFGMTETNNKKFTYEGKININTAALPVLTAILPSGNPELAQAIYDYR